MSNLPAPVTLICRSCRQGAMMSVERIERFRPPGVPAVPVAVLAARCGHCGFEAVLPSQMEENLRRRAARKEHYGTNLLGEDIFELRRRLGLSLQDAASIFGTSPGEFARYESERSFPDEGTRMLLESAMTAPASLPALACKVGVAVPSWQARGTEQEHT